MLVEASAGRGPHRRLEQRVDHGGHHEAQRLLVLGRHGDVGAEELRGRQVVAGAAEVLALLAQLVLAVDRLTTGDHDHVVQAGEHALARIADAGLGHVAAHGGEQRRGVGRTHRVGDQTTGVRVPPHAADHEQAIDRRQQTRDTGIVGGQPHRLDHQLVLLERLADIVQLLLVLPDADDHRRPGMHTHLS